MGGTCLSFLLVLVFFLGSFLSRELALILCNKTDRPTDRPSVGKALKETPIHEDFVYLFATVWVKALLTLCCFACVLIVWRFVWIVIICTLVLKV
jgi:hypothetical protein